MLPSRSTSPDERRVIELRAAVIRADAGDLYDLGAWCERYLPELGEPIAVMLCGRSRNRLGGRPRKSREAVPKAGYAARVARAIDATKRGDPSSLNRMMRPDLSRDEADTLADYFSRRWATRSSGRREGSGQHLVTLLSKSIAREVRNDLARIRRSTVSGRVRPGDVRSAISEAIERLGVEGQFESDVVEKLSVDDIGELVRRGR